MKKYLQLGAVMLVALSSSCSANSQAIDESKTSDFYDSSSSTVAQLPEPECPHSVIFLAAQLEGHISRLEEVHHPSIGEGVTISQTIQEAQMVFASPYCPNAKKTLAQPLGKAWSLYEKSQFNRGVKFAKVSLLNCLSSSSEQIGCSNQYQDEVLEQQKKFQDQIQRIQAFFNEYR
ncbi:hypothetical protein [Roseofilum capinflatum]|uniref:Lipoprotein n=1 Tax=Roseofilum capinflatum BLCC-M114 TaxID=3022440 RepID=A0ABT7B0X3_9CYAN|nr:hypothetical protein [Roseofilum capinflatum]MDJ1172795.1 hypothetical protein [Roseofilum capinflatum BLCC-M114]